MDKQPLILQEITSNTLKGNNIYFCKPDTLHLKLEKYIETINTCIFFTGEDHPKFIKDHFVYDSMEDFPYFIEKMF